jgi:hypothetical protein
MDSPDATRSKRVKALFACVALIAAGLASRRHAAALPDFVAAYAGDTLWATLVYALATVATPRAAIATRAAAALTFALAIETSQLCRADWLDAIRATRLGALVLGSGFLWSDLACYAVGIALGAFTEAACAGVARRRSLP